MTYALLIITFLLAGACGYWIMDRADRFMKKHVNGEQEEKDGQQRRTA